LQHRGGELTARMLGCARYASYSQRCGRYSSTHNTYSNSLNSTPLLN
jgi:hypothetical protein